jgi:hypothetical protein
MFIIFFSPHLITPAEEAGMRLHIFVSSQGDRGVAIRTKKNRVSLFGKP